ncbi:alpha/beta fold hydrolase [Qingshengfaniella alkalisoli]|nr:alpha/beta hydrolase [Qingshengfaniella alkalisoli]
MKIVTTATALMSATVAHADFATVNGHDIYYELHGDLDAGGTPILMLHGGMMNITSTFGEMIPDLLSDYPIIGVEQQGHGHTPLNDQPITLENMRLDTLAVLDAVEVEKVHVVGFSAGGMLALELAVNAPERVESMTAISASTKPEGFLPDLLRVHREPGFQPPPEIAALFPSEDEFAEMSADIAEMNPGGAEVVPETMGKMSQLIASDWGWSQDQIAGISAPALIAIGDNDFILPKHAVEMAETIPDAHLAVLPNTTHMTILEQPELLPIIKRFIQASVANTDE